MRKGASEKLHCCIVSMYMSYYYVMDIAILFVFWHWRNEQFTGKNNLNWYDDIACCIYIYNVCVYYNVVLVYIMSISKNEAKIKNVNLQ